MAIALDVLTHITAKRPACSAVIAAAGSSERMGREDKLFLEIQGMPVLVHSLLPFQNSKQIDEIIVVARGDMLERVGGLCVRHGINKVTKVMAGGQTRVESVMSGVFAISKKSTLVAIHDGARPCVGMATIKYAIDAAAKYHTAAPAIPVSSTIKKAKNNYVTATIDRDGLFEIQTPQVFDADLIKAALTKAVKAAKDITDDCMAAELIGASVRLTEGSRLNIKITTKEDLNLAEAIIMFNAVCGPQGTRD